MNTPKTDEVQNLFWNTGNLGLEMTKHARQLETQVQELREALESIKGCADALVGLQPNLAQMNKICAISSLARTILEKTK